MNATDDGDIIARRTLDTNRETPATEVVELVADLENREPTDLAPIYYTVNELLADLFSSPPRATADAAIEFTYEGYQFRVRQDGTTTVTSAGV
ncbi:HalOD1 output domain-containing protein [Natronococcus sp.]|uniref:HalOD1 output domain-containing protein n=1 Tax=Natronococcus sp. TaxID=35747 RepID=UPI003A4DC4AB